MGKYLRSQGYDFPIELFVSRYRKVATAYRTKRYKNLQEVGNHILVSETLRMIGIGAKSADPHVTSAVEHYFTPWKITLAPDAHRVLEDLNGRFTLSLISNFTNSAFLNRSLNNLGINRFFDHIIDSLSIGWRKPHQRIFKHFLDLSGVKAKEAIFIGDDLNADIKGAKNLGIKAVLLKKSEDIESNSID